MLPSLPRELFIYGVPSRYIRISFCRISVCRFSGCFYSPRDELVLEHAGQIVAVLGEGREEVLKLVREVARRADVHGQHALGNVRGGPADDVMTIRHRGRCHIFTGNFTGRRVPRATSQTRDKPAFPPIRAHRTWQDAVLLARSPRRDKRIRSPASPEERRDRRRRRPPEELAGAPHGAQRGMI